MHAAQCCDLLAAPCLLTAHTSLLHLNSIMALGRVGYAVVERWASFKTMLAGTRKATLHVECFDSPMEAGS